MFSDNPNLTCIDVDDPDYSTANWLVSFGMIDSTMSFSNNCLSVFIGENTTSRELIETINILGRETNNKGFQLHLYDDGSVEKKYVIE